MPSASYDLNPSEEATRASACRPKLAYILSASHSGSTLLAMLLGAHPEACTVGELKATNLGNPDLYRCSCGQFIKQCAFWKRVSAGMAVHGIPDFDITRAGTSIYESNHSSVRRLLAPLYRGPLLEAVRDAGLSLFPAWRALREGTQKRNAALVRVLRDLNGAQVVVDSSKMALRLKYLLRNPGLEIKVIRLIRDGRAVALTYTDDWSFADAADASLRGGGSGRPRTRRKLSMAEAAREWKRSNEAADCLVRRLPVDQWMQVRYEDLCGDARGTLQSLCAFLGIAADKIDLNFRSREQHVVGNGMRFDSSSEIRLDDRWRTNLTEEDLETFEVVAGRVNREYGYR